MKLAVLILALCTNHPYWDKATCGVKTKECIADEVKNFPTKGLNKKDALFICIKSQMAVCREIAEEDAWNHSKDRK